MGEVAQHNNIRGGDILKKEECNVDRRVQVLTLVVKQPTSSHLVQPIAWRCPDRGLNSTNDVCRTENLVPCAKDRGIRYPCRRLKQRNHNKVDLQGLVQSAVLSNFFQKC